MFNRNTHDTDDKTQLRCRGRKLLSQQSPAQTGVSKDFHW